MQEAVFLLILALVLGSSHLHDNSTGVMLTRDSIIALVPVSQDCNHRQDPHHLRQGHTETKTDHYSHTCTNHHCTNT